MIEYFLTNLPDTRKKDASKFVAHSTHETPQEAWKHQQEWLKNKSIGRPHEAKFYTVEQLESMGYVGIYEVDEIGLTGKDAKEFLAALLNK